MERFVIRLEDIHFYSRIGLLDQERKVGNDFRVDVSVETDATNFEYENLNTSISYADIFDIISNQMEEERLLLESTAKSIAEVIKRRWACILDVNVKITKMSPPINGIQGVCSVEYCHSND